MANETPLIVLAVLEWKGLTTEEDLASEVKVQPHKLSNILFDLQKDALIEFGRNSVRISAKGKILLDRFNIDEGVIDNLLDSLSIRETERSAYRNVLGFYRDAAFSQYLNTQCTIKTWETIADRIPHRKRLSRYGAQKKVGKLTLLIRDLRNWFVHAHPPLHIFDELTDPIRIAITSTDRQLIARTKGPAGAAAKASAWLSILHQPEPKLQWEELESAEARLLQSIFILDEFQKGWEKNVWFDTWCDVHPMKNYRSANQFFVVLTDSLPKGQRLNLLADLKDSRVLGSSSWWVNESANDLSENFLGMLMLSSSVSDLIAITGMNKESVEAALSVIERKCRDLLAEEQDEQTPEQK
jgi:hypothetical protein